MDLADANGTCFMSAAGMDVTPDSITEGIKYSWPTYKQGLRILTKATVETGDTWSVFRVFDWRVWLAMGGTAILVGVILYITETFQPRMMRRMMYNIKDESDFGERPAGFNGHELG